MAADGYGGGAENCGCGCPSHRLGRPIGKGSTWTYSRLTPLLRFDADSVVHGSAGADTLLAAKVSLGGLDRHASKQELDLIQLASGSMAQFRAGPTQIMRRELRDPDLPGVVLHHVPDQAFGDAFTLMLTCATDATKHLPR